ncbi:LPS export ABC transporter periplasmic protein LptC [Novosphingobium sp. G106]|uniref:LPS export ABC transporter periplasmic protein LptC n=1 Tax=Novosphingobium sp. G106 TaxID=2849500 RepID=UPI001C2CF9BF|nr:LPS export ABC transporter periplasmic protein LptC [Novosphingobium sp. G106]MBV1691919.1 LPS export ABC transporter periplasmic protein LptC [Novosphingobium sp. G106]
MQGSRNAIDDERRAFALPGGSHDHTLRVLSIALPFAIGLMAAIMLLDPLRHRPEVSLLIDRHKVPSVGKRFAVASASYRGRDARGRTFSISVENAEQETLSPPIVRMTGLIAAIDLESGPAKVTALSGDYDYAENTLQIPGQAVFVAPDDLKLTSSRTAIDLRAQRVVASGPVAGKTAIGTFSADAMELDLEGRTMALIGRARLRMISREKDNGP